MIEFEAIPSSIGFYVYRAMVPGGWLVIITVDSDRRKPLFIPDPEHKWLAEEPR